MKIIGRELYVLKVSAETGKTKDVSTGAFSLWETLVGVHGVKKFKTTKIIS